MCFLAFLLLGCRPPSLPAPPPALAAPPSVRRPIDARPPAERHEPLPYVGLLPVPQRSWSDPIGALERVDRTVRAAAHGLTPPLTIDVWVLRHRVRRDRSDAHWVSTVTGGLAGLVGRFLYSETIEAEAWLRVDIRRDGQPWAVRDVEAFAIRRLPVAKTWRIWSLYRDDPVRDAAAEALTELHEQLRWELRALFLEAVAGTPPTAGHPPVRPAPHSLRRPWERPESLLPAGARTPLLRAKYPAPTFAVVSGHEHRTGAIVGRIGTPLDTVGYDIGVAPSLQLLLDVTVLGRANAATVGLRWRPLPSGRFGFSVQARAGGYATASLRPPRIVLAGTTASVGATVSFRPERLTWFVRGGPTTLWVREPAAPFVALDQGSAVGLTVAPGVEAPLSPTTVLAVQLVLLGRWRAGVPLTRGIGPFLPIPQLTLGFR